MEFRPAALAEYDRCFVSCWDGIFTRCIRPGPERVWLAGPSSYVFAAGGCRWGVDLQIRRESDLEKLRDRVAAQLSPLRFVLITHQHDDHLCVPLLRLLKDLPIRWYLPADCRRDLIRAAGLREEQIRRVREGEVYREGELEILPFFSPHVLPGEPDFPQCGYRVRTGKQTLLFPGDVRDYSYRGYPAGEAPDVLFSHLWLGNCSTDPERYLPMLEQYADFTARFGARRILLGHLYEIGREERYLWHYAHAGLAMDALLARSPETTVEIPRLGRTIRLEAEP